MNSVEILKKLSVAFGVSGFEDEVREIIGEIVRPLAEDVRVDRLGNIIATKSGRRDEWLMLDAHMDEVGFLVSYVEPSGFLRLAPIGGWDARILPAHAVSIRTPGHIDVRGVIGTIPPAVLSDEDRSRPVTLESLFVDIGANNPDEVRDLGVNVGDPCLLGYGFEQLNEDLVMGKAFDDRAGCTVAIRVLEQLQNANLDLSLAVAFTVGEEIGLKGARTAATQISPAVALALEGTTAVDIPGITGARRTTTMGAGAALTVADRSGVSDKRVVGLLEEIASKEQIRVQRKHPIFGATDASAIQTSGSGVMTAVVSVPCRYIHTPLSLLRPTDLESAVQLVTSFTQSAGALIP